MQLFTQCSQCFSPVIGTVGDKSWVTIREKWKHSNAPSTEKNQALFVSEDGSAFGANQSDLNFTAAQMASWEIIENV